MKLVKGIFVAIFLLMFLMEQTLFAFGGNGHRIVAEVAQRHLTPKAQQAVKNILRGETLAHIATSNLRPTKLIYHQKMDLLIINMLI